MLLPFDVVLLLQSLDEELPSDLASLSCGPVRRRTQEADDDSIQDLDGVYRLAALRFLADGVEAAVLLVEVAQPLEASLQLPEQQLAPGGTGPLVQELDQGMRRGKQGKHHKQGSEGGSILGDRQELGSGTLLSIEDLSRRLEDGCSERMRDKSLFSHAAFIPLPFLIHQHSVDSPRQS